MINAQAQESYYNDGGMDYNNYYKSKDSSKSVNLNKIKWINTNLNINGNNTGDVNIGNKGQGYLGANSYGGYFDGYSNNNQDKGFDCVINNNNTNTNINLGVGGNQAIPPKEPTATLNITKVVESRETGTSPTPGTLCQELLPHITEDQFLFQVEGNNPNPSSPFPGSEAGTDVTLGTGNYVVSETLDEAGITELNNFRTNHPTVHIPFLMQFL